VVDSVLIHGIVRQNVRVKAKRTREGECRGQQGTEAVKPGSQETQAEKESGRKAVGGEGAGAKNLKTAATKRAASGEVGAR
jgi:hypothetical protein